MALPDMMRRRREKKQAQQAVPKLPEKKKPETLDERVSEIYERFVTKSHAEVTGLWEMLGSRRRLVWVNFLAGLSRGVGFFLGVTLIGGLLIGATAFLLDKTAETLGWKDVTFASAVQSVYSKFQEVRSVIENMEDKGAGSASATPSAGQAAGMRYTAPAYQQRQGPSFVIETGPPMPPPQSTGVGVEGG